MGWPLTVVLVRHGQSEWNACGLLQGQTPDVPLTDLGHEQAISAARALAALSPGAILCSDLLRATQTAEHCARLLGLPYSTTPALRERAYGVLEGRACRDVTDLPGWGDPTWAPGGGESLVQLHRRVESYLRQLRADPPADVVALVTHGDTIRAAQAAAAGQGPEAMPLVPPCNGSLTVLELPTPCAADAGRYGHVQCGPQEIVPP